MPLACYIKRSRAEISCMQSFRNSSHEVSMKVARLVFHGNLWIVQDVSAKENNKTSSLNEGHSLEPSLQNDVENFNQGKIPSYYANKWPEANLF